VLAPRTLFGWPAVLLRLLHRDGDRHLPGGRRARTVRRYQARQVRIRSARPVHREFDGEVLPVGSALDVTVEPGALLVRLPGPAAEPSASAPDDRRCR
jgi:hypothetical protein